MKKIVFLILILLVSAGAVFSGDISLAFEDARFHSDYLFGFAPLYVRAGVDYTGVELIDGQRTDLIFILGGALISSETWTDVNGLPLNPDAEVYSDPVFRDYNAYSKLQGDFGFTLKQGLIHEPGRQKALFAVYGKYGFHYASPHENNRETDGGSSFLSGSSTAYPDNSGTVTNTLKAGVEVDRLDKDDVFSGFNINSSITYGPSWFFNTLHGTSDFVSLNMTAAGFLPILDLKQEGSDLTLLGIYLGDRVMIDYAAGSAVPQFYQESPSLGTKMRGFDNNSMGVNFTAVNNLDLRIYGYEFIDNINPVATLFFDTGYFAGKYYNTDYEGSGLVCSTGFEIALNIVDFAQIGYRFGFPLIGTNMAESTMKSGLMLMYMF